MDSSKEDPRGIEELFHASLARPPSERHQFLQQACKGDEHLQQEVASLLACDREADGFLDGLTEDQRDVMVIGYQAVTETRNDVFSAGDESSFLIARRDGFSLSYLFRMRSGKRALFVYLVGYMDDSPEFWRELLGPHVRSLETLQVTPSE